MDNIPTDQTSDNKSQNQQRDSATLSVLGTFFLIMGTLVLVATYGTIGNTPALVVSLCSSLVLLGVGAGMHFVSRRLAK